MAHIGAGAVGARDAIHDIPPPLCGKAFVIIMKDQVPSFHELLNTTNAVVSRLFSAELTNIAVVRTLAGKKGHISKRDRTCGQ